MVGRQALQGRGLHAIQIKRYHENKTLYQAVTKV
jgi:hypothetical protein